jgi:hypothetical protein
MCVCVYQQYHSNMIAKGLFIQKKIILCHTTPSDQIGSVLSVSEGVAQRRRVLYDTKYFIV